MKTFKLMLCFLISCGTFSTLFAGNPFISIAQQTILNSRGDGIKDQTLFTSGSTITALQVHDRTEKVTITFVTDHWLDLTSQVQTTGSGFDFSRIVSKGITDRMLLASGITIGGEFTYCEVEFTINKDASIGSKTVRLRRPNMAFGMDEEVFTVNVKKSARIYAVGMATGSTTPPSDNGTQFWLQATVHGFDANIPFLTTGGAWLENHSTSQKGKFLFEFSTKFKKFGRFGSAELGSCLNVPSDIVLVTATNTPNTFVTVANSSVTLASGGGGGGGGGVITRPPSGGIGGGGGTTAAFDLAVSFRSIFASSGATFIASEMGNYNLCPTTSNPKIATVSNLTIRVTNLGTANSVACTVDFDKGTNANFASDLTFNIPVLTPGQSMDFVIPRIENRVCGTTNSTGACIRCGSGVQGINHWNDKGTSATLGGCTGDSNTSNNTQTIF